MRTQTFQVRKDSLHTTRIGTSIDQPLADRQVRLVIDRFALTSNNITYAAFGAAMHYWQFFPVAGDDADGWGCIPVWGFGRVVQSLHPGVAVGDRLYGYWPMASHALLQPVKLTAAGFADGTPHRAGLHAVYNQYKRCEADPFYSADTEDLQALLRPLYLTAWLIDDFLADNDWFGANAGAAASPPRPALMLLSSASSKTAYATAERLARRAGIQVPGACRTWGVDSEKRPQRGQFLPDLQAHSPAMGQKAGVLEERRSQKWTAEAVSQPTIPKPDRLLGLTSAANIAFCESLGVYHRVLAYEQLDALPADTPCVYVDFAGNAALRLAIHSRFTALAHSSAIGGTHVQQLGGGRDLPGPRATLFFAPAQVKKRSTDWGPGEFGKRLVTAWHGFRAQVAQPAAPWLVVQQHGGAEAMAAAYVDVLGGKGDLRLGHVLSLNSAG